MDYSFGIASASRTLVVVPTMLGSAEGVEALVEALEVRFLANRDPNLHFGLLTDLHDAATEHLPGDAALVDLAAARIEALNAKYRREGDAPAGNAFYLFHRARRWNARERVWMGYERKRGKLADLNALLRGRAGVGPGEAFDRLVGELLWLSAVRYVITLDTDTELPRGAAARMVATMAHPLNRPRFGSGRQHDLVVEGYGILQPRIAASLPSTTRSLYARFNGGDPGIDPYTRAVSDVYQDLFDEGSFIGKGIYDVDAFERALADRLPENRILSHDLLEGCYARCGLLSDVQLIEGAPASYGADVTRRYRWIRGDWQLAGWLRRRVRALPQAPLNQLSTLSRLKIFDNLRRSAVPLALLSLFLAGWFLLPAPGWITLYAVGIVGLIPLAAHFASWLRRPLQMLRSGMRTAAPADQPAVRLLLQGLHTLASLPFEASYSSCRDRSHAVARSVVEAPSAGVAAIGRRARRHGARDLCRPGAHHTHAGPRPVACGRLRGRAVVAATRGAAGGGSRLAAVVAVAAARVVARPAAHAPASGTDVGPDRVPAPTRAPDMELLRSACHRGGPSPSARQRAGTPRGARRSSNVTDEHGLRAARRTGGPRVRLPHHGPVADAAGRGPGDDGALAAVSGPLLQLVRHDHAGAAASALRFERRQRQPRRAASHAALGTAGARGRAAAARRVA